MALEDLMQAFGALKQSVGELSQQRAINSAQQDVEAIRASQAQDSEKESQLRNLANDLTLKLSNFGASPQKIEQIYGAVAPPKGTPFQSLEGGLAEAIRKGDDDTAEKLRGEIMRQEDFKMGIEEKKAQVAANRLASQQGFANQKRVNDTLKDFRDKEAKNQISAIETINALEGAASTGQFTALEGIKSAIVKIFEGGAARVSDQDVARQIADPSLRTTILRNANKYLMGKPLDEDFKDYGSLIKVMKTVAQKKLEQKIGNFSKATAPQINMDSGALKDLLMVKHESDLVSAPSSDPQAEYIKIAIANGYTAKQAQEKWLERTKPSKPLTTREAR